MRTYLLIFLFPLLISCVSYHKEYEHPYLGPRTSYNYYNSPIRWRYLNHHDFYMIDKQPREFFKTQMWSGINTLSHMTIHTFFRNIIR